jgi:hypothetical protein
MGCHLGWHFTVGCPLRGGRGKCKIIGTSVPPKTIKKKKSVQGALFTFGTLLTT